MAYFVEKQKLGSQLDLLRLPPMTVVRSANGWPLIVRGDGIVIDRHGNAIRPQRGQGSVPYTIVSLPPTGLKLPQGYTNTTPAPSVIDGGKP